MNILIISDTHLTNKFNQKLYKRLYSIISDSDLVIINGDFWEGYKISFDEFIDSEWNKLFPLLKEKNAIYLLGNHDYLVNGKVSLFSNKCVKALDIEIGGQKYHIEHGNRIVTTFEEKRKRIEIRKLFGRIAIFIGLVGTLLIGEEFFKIRMPQNRRMKDWKKQVLEKDTFLICGHSHLQEINNQIKFANSGVITNKYFQYITIKDNQVTSHFERT